LIASWLGMQLVHELGHVMAAYATGGSVERVVLHPLELSRTDLARNPRPLAVASAGPLGGAGLFLWHGQGNHFGLGHTADEVSVVAIAVTTISCVILIAIGCATGRA
jgi:hypothetical protein